MKLDPKDNILYTLRDMGVPFLQEYQFLKDRKFRFDFCLLEPRIAIEFEGVFGGGKSRHTTAIGYTNDCEKYNLAAIHGWRILRYTAKNYTDLRHDLELMLNQLYTNGKSS
jgi:very-short-patch-repair endonuclease